MIQRLGFVFPSGMVLPEIPPYYSKKGWASNPVTEKSCESGFNPLLGLDKPRRWDVLFPLVG